MVAAARASCDKASCDNALTGPDEVDENARVMKTAPTHRQPSLIVLLTLALLSPSSVAATPAKSGGAPAAAGSRAALAGSYHGLHWSVFPAGAAAMNLGGRSATELQIPLLSGSHLQGARWDAGRVIASFTSRRSMSEVLRWHDASLTEQGFKRSGNASLVTASRQANLSYARGADRLALSLTQAMPGAFRMVLDLSGVNGPAMASGVKSGPGANKPSGGAASKPSGGATGTAVATGVAGAAITAAKPPANNATVNGSAAPVTTPAAPGVVGTTGAGNTGSTATLVATATPKPLDVKVVGPDGAAPGAKLTNGQGALMLMPVKDATGFASNRDGNQVLLGYHSKTDLGAQFKFYDDLLTRQGFTRKSGGTVSADNKDEIKAVYTLGSGSLDLTAQRFGDPDGYRVIANFDTLSLHWGL